MHRAAFVVLAANLALLAAWPWLAGTAVRDATEPCYSALCHRKSERCLTYSGEPMPACARCVGVWLGLLLGAGVAVGRGRLWSFAAGCGLVAWMLASWAVRAWLPAG